MTKRLLALLLSFSASLSAQIRIGPVNPLPNSLFTQYGTTPVLLKGSTYDGWTADALAAPAVTGKVASGTFAGDYVMTVSFWSIANSKWASGFFTSPDLVTWTYVTSSLQTPQGTDYIIGNSGLVVSGSTFIWAYTHYASGATNHQVTIATSTDLVTWTVVNSSPTGAAADGDPNLNFNPDGTLELETDDNGTTPGTVKLYTSTDTGTTWTARGTIYPLHASVGGFNTGEPSVWYTGTVRNLIWDIGGNALTGARFTQSASSPYQSTAWNWPQTSNVPNGSLAWQAGQVFDAAVIVTDTGDGHGSIPWMVYAGGDNSSTTDNTDSSIGLAYLIQ